MIILEPDACTRPEVRSRGVVSRSGEELHIDDVITTVT